MTDTFVRLLFCHTCKSVDQLPDYSGPADHDYYLQHRVAQHRTPSGQPHRGVLSRCKDDAEVIRAAVEEMEHTVSPGGGVGLGQAMYDLRDNYNEQAMACWKKHNRTQNCDDYKSDKMRLWIDTKAERKDLGWSTNREDRPNIWLCDHCPYKSLVQQRKNKAEGLYD